MQVKFLREERVLDGNRNVVQHFLAGQVVELSTASAQRWIRREAAVRVNASVPLVSPRAEVMPKPPAAETAMPDPKEEPVKRKPGRPKKADSGASPASGPAKPSASSAADPASPASTSSTSEDDAESLPSTTPTSSLPGQMSSTPAMQHGGESTETPPASED